MPEVTSTRNHGAGAPLTLNNLFRHPYTRIDYVLNDLTVTRQTAARYLDTLAEHGFVEKHRAGKNNYYVNTSLVRLLMTVSEDA